MEFACERLLDDAYLAGRAKLIDMKRAQDFGAGNPVKGGTIYLTAADESGMMVSFIQSNYMGFGSGVVVPGLGRLDAEPRPRLQPRSGQPEPRRPRQAPVPHDHPGVPDEGRPAADELRRDGRQHAAAGPPADAGAHARLHRQQPQAACDAPRWRFNQGLEINVEAAMDPATVQGLVARGHQVDVIDDSYQDFGAGQFIWRLGDPAVEGYVAASDPRRDGQAAAF